MSNVNVNIVNVVPVENTAVIVGGQLYTLLYYELSFSLDDRLLHLSVGEGALFGAPQRA